MSVTPRGMSVQEAYREFRDGNFRVNRRYQRKLVWSLEEKRKLIDSLLHGFPIPLFLLAVSPRPSGGRVYEIIDGMQRLNAIFSFVENKFAYNHKYFDVEQLSRAKQVAHEGMFKAVSDPAGLLSAAECANLLDYQLAVTEFPGTNKAAVNEVFGRINAYGRHLSDQERRQAGVVTAFATTVRELAAQLRGDVSSESLDLADMPQISIDIGGEVQGYGVTADETFWCKQNILRRSQLRESEDEQFLADLIVSIVSEKAFAFSGKNLDLIYSSTSADSRQTEDLLLAYGTERLKAEIIATFSIIQETIEAVDPGPSALPKVLHPKGAANPIKTAFYALFMAFFDLCIKQQRAPSNPAAIMKALQNLQSKLHVSAGAITSESRLSNINVTKGLIQDNFETASESLVTHGPGSILQFENILRRSKVETAAFECKQGLLSLDSLRKQQPLLLERITETLSAIANLGPAPSGNTFIGAIFIGVADKESDQERIEQLDGITPMLVGSRYCVGIDRELKYLGIASVEEYLRRIVTHISNSKLSEALKHSILTNIDSINYKGRTIIALWVPSQREVAGVDDKIYYREDSATKEATGLAKSRAILDLFR